MADTAHQETYGQGAFTVERLVRDIAEALYAEPAEVLTDESLLDQGLDSIRLMTLVEQWRADGAVISFVELAERPTVRDWAALLDRSG
jgi:aryl carrier-like protein